MKSKLEDNVLLFFGIFILFALELFLFINLFRVKINTYKVFNGFVVKDNYISVLLSNSDLVLINSNKYLNYQDKKISYEIMDVQRNVVFGYHNVILKCRSYNKKVNELYSFSVFDKKLNLIEVFKVIWME